MSETLAQTIREAVPHWVLGGFAAELGPDSVHTADCPACLVAPALNELLRLLDEAQTRTASMNGIVAYLEERVGELDDALGKLEAELQSLKEKS